VGLFHTDFFERAIRKPWVIALLKRTVPPLDKFLLKLSRGWVSTAMQSIALLQMTGAKSGQRREIVTLCMPDADDIYLVGSNWGLDSDPAWVRNLRANPAADVTFRGYKGPVSASELIGDDRQKIWPQLVAYNPQYARYQSGTDRILPVIKLALLR
jgi:deazaflavin-dependent oxidoreductase (nitroreductase family)